jgi:hypothetical protein
MDRTGCVVRDGYRSRITRPMCRVTLEDSILYKAVSAMLTPPMALAALCLPFIGALCTGSSMVELFVLGWELLCGDCAVLLRAGVGMVGESMRS